MESRGRGEADVSNVRMNMHLSCSVHFNRNF